MINLSKASISSSQAEIDLSKASLSPSQAEKLVRESCNDFLKTRRGLSYLCMKYPHLSVSQAVDEYIKIALWIDHII